MKFTILNTFLVAALGASAQTVSFVAPAFNAPVTAGVPFTVSLALQETTSSVNVVALFLGFQPGGDATNQELGNELSIIVAPRFTTLGPNGQIVDNINVTIPVGQAGPINVTCGEFYTLGAVNTPLTNVAKTRVIVSQSL